MCDELGDGLGRDRRYSNVQNSEPTGRSAKFYAPLDDEQDVEAIAQRVAQHCAVALQRGEADAIQVVVKEGSGDGE